MNILVLIDSCLPPDAFDFQWGNGCPLLYHNWQIHAPNENPSQEVCVRYIQLLMDDNSCTRPCGYICEKMGEFISDGLSP